MIGILFFGVIIGYIFFVKFAVTKIYEYTQEKIVRNIALVIFIFIPTWDIILGYPIYKYLCWNNAGVHVYKATDNVGGFYIGKKSKQYEPYVPYNGYSFIDYKEKESDKYYRSYWVDNNISKDCVPYGIYKFGDYANAFYHGKCIVKKEIPKSEVSRWEYISISRKKLIIPIVNIYEYKTVVRDRNTNQIIAENLRYALDNNWFLGSIRNITSSKGMWSSCGNHKDLELLKKTLKTKKEEE